MIRRSLLARLVMPLALVVALLAAMLLLAGQARHRTAAAQQAVLAMHDQALALAELRSTSRSLQRDALNLVLERDGDERRSIRNRFDKRAGEFDAGMAALPARPLGIAPAEFALYRRAQAVVLDRLRAVRRTAGADRGAALHLFRHAVRPQERRASEIADAMVERSIVASARLRADAATMAEREHAALNALSTILSIVALVGGAALVSFSVLRPLRAIGAAMEQLAAGNADIAIPGTARRDEIGTMARAIAVFQAATRERDHLRQASEQARRADAQREREQAAADLRDDAEARQRLALEQQRRELLHDLAAAVDDCLRAVNDKLRASGARLTRSAEDVARHAGAAGSEAGETARAAEALARELTAAGAAAEQVAGGMAEMEGRAQTATGAVRLAIARSRTAAARVSGLSAYADRVGEMVELIKAVANRSQLLALNATIEAARAGQVGRGFGVVAGEMKSLAFQTAAAASHVEAQLSAIRASAGEGTEAIGEMEDAVLQIERNADVVARLIVEQGAANAEIGRGVAVALDTMTQVGGRMADLGRTARGTQAVAVTLHTDAEVLRADAASVDMALGELVGRLKAA